MAELHPSLSAYLDQVAHLGEAARRDVTASHLTGIAWAFETGNLAGIDASVAAGACRLVARLVAGLPQPIPTSPYDAAWRKQWNDGWNACVGAASLTPSERNPA